MPRVRADVLELVFAAAVVVVFASAAAAVVGRASRQLLLTLTSLLAVTAAVGWVAFALDPSTELAVTAGGLTVCAVFELGTVAVLRLVGRAQDVDRRLEETEARFDAAIAAAADSRSAELERTLARARADSLSKLVVEERRIAEERRAALAEREYRAGAELSEALANVEQRIAPRPGELNADL